jgi:hypothetical protein
MNTGFFSEILQQKTI